MRINIFPGNPSSDRKILIDTLYRLLNTPRDTRRFDWLYSDCPYAQSRAWLVAEERGNSIVGAAAAFPRAFHLGGEKVSVWVLGDFCLDPQYRSLGPALQLQRACLSVLETDGAAFCYDFPSASMVAVYKRLGYDVTGKMLRLAKPLRVDRKVKGVITNPVAQQVAVAVGNRLLKIASPKTCADESLEVAAHAEDCGAEFTALAEEQSGKFGFCLHRSAEYLNWRYVNNPLARHEIITARRAGHLVGYVVWTQAGEDASIVDLFGEEDAGMVRRLVAEITILAHKRGAVTLSVSLNESHRWRSLFGEMRFRVRDSAPIVIITSKSFAEKIDPQLSGWYLMHGDRDS